MSCCLVLKCNYKYRYIRLPQNDVQQKPYTCDSTQQCSWDIHVTQNYAHNEAFFERKHYEFEPGTYSIAVTSTSLLSIIHLLEMRKSITVHNLLTYKSANTYHRVGNEKINLYNFSSNTGWSILSKSLSKLWGNKVVILLAACILKFCDFSGFSIKMGSSTSNALYSTSVFVWMMHYCIWWSLYYRKWMRKSSCESWNYGVSEGISLCWHLYTVNLHLIRSTNVPGG